MTKLIERVGAETKVEGEPIDLSTLVFSGCELVEAQSYGYNELYRERALKENREKVLNQAANFARQYGCECFIIGGNPITSENRRHSDIALVYIVSFFKKRQ